MGMSKRMKGELKPIEINCLFDELLYRKFYDRLCDDCLVKMKCLKPVRSLEFGNDDRHWMIWIQTPCRRFGHKMKKLDDDYSIFYVHKVWQGSDYSINKYTIDWKYNQFIREHELRQELLEELRRLGIGGPRE